MNNLARLAEAKGDAARELMTVSSVDPQYLRAIEAASREFEERTRRHFYARVATRYFTGRRKCRTELLLPFDVASITSLALDDDGDGTYELTLVDGTDYFSYREDDDNNKPIYRLEINPNGTQISGWPTPDYPRALKMVCLEGYSYELESTGLPLAANINDSATTLTASGAASKVFPGDTLVLDSEQMDVTAVSGDTVTVTRAINGTTAAAHTTADTLYVRRFPREVESIVRERALARRVDAQMGHIGGPQLEEMSQTSSIRGAWPRWVAAVNAFRREMAVA